MLRLISIQLFGAALFLACATTQAGLGDGIIVEYLFPASPDYIGQDTSGNDVDSPGIKQVQHVGPIVGSLGDSRDCAEFTYGGYMQIIPSPVQDGFAFKNLLPNGAEPRTVCAWVNPQPYAVPGLRVIVGFGLDNDNDLELIIAQNKSIMVDAGTPEREFVVGELPTIDDGKWNFVCLASEVDAFDIFYGDSTSAVQKVQRTTPSPHDVFMYFASIGSNPFLLFNFFHGYMDDVRIWNRVLSDAEVEQVRTLTGTVSTDRDTRCPSGYYRHGSFCYWDREKDFHSTDSDYEPPRGIEICTVMGGEISHTYDPEVGDLTCRTDPVPDDQLADRIVESSHPYANSEFFQRVVALPDTRCYKVWFDPQSKTKNFSDQVRIYRRNWGKKTSDGAQTALVEPVKYEETFTEGVGSSYEEAYEIHGNSVVIEMETSRFGYSFGFIAYIAACPST